MAIKTEFVHCRIESTLKKEGDRILNKIGLNTAQAITLFYKQLSLRGELPFTVEIPNTETLETFAKTDRGEELRNCTN